MKLSKRIEKLQGYIGRQVELSRPAPPSGVIQMLLEGQYVSVPVYNEDASALDVECGKLSEILITSEEVTLTLLKDDGELYWHLTPDTRIVSLD